MGTDVLEWLSDEETRKLDDDIEEVNANMLDFIITTNPYVAVIFSGKICFLSKNVDWEEWTPLPSCLSKSINEKEKEWSYHVMSVPSPLFFIPNCKKIDVIPSYAIFLFLLSEDNPFFHSPRSRFYPLSPKLENIFLFSSTCSFPTWASPCDLFPPSNFSPGDLSVESSVYEWLIDDDNRELQGTIEEVNRAMLKRLIEYNPFVAVVFISKKGYSTKMYK